MIMIVENEEIFLVSLVENAKSTEFNDKLSSYSWMLNANNCYIQKEILFQNAWLICGIFQLFKLEKE